MVVANPFASPLDADGYPCTFVQYDPEHVGGDGKPRYIGCRLDRKTIKPRVMTVARRREDRRQYARVETTIFYDLTPTPVVHSAYHRDMIRDGGMIAADKATWTLVGGKGEFEEPAAIIERECSARIAEWLSDHPGATLDPSMWSTEKAPRIKGMPLAKRSPIAASTVAERVDAQKKGQKLAEGDGMAKTGIPITTRTEAPASAGSIQ